MNIESLDPYNKTIQYQKNHMFFQIQSKQKLQSVVLYYHKVETFLQAIEYRYKKNVHKDY